MTFALLGNSRKPRFREAAEKLIAYAKRKGVRVFVDEELRDAVKTKCPVAPPAELAKSCDVAITLGGDGTVMKAAHRVGFLGLPILGINTGTLGFLAAAPVREMTQTIDDVLNGNVVREERACITATLGGAGSNRANAINEIVVERRAAMRMIRVEMHVDEKYLNTYFADGVIIATPTGSTAYSLAAGGPIVSTSSNVFLITPLAPHTLTARPLIVPDSVTIRMVVNADSETCSMIADGQGSNPLITPAVIHLRRAKKSVIFIRRKTVTEYDILRAKLLWGKDTRAAGRRRNSSDSQL